MKKKYRFKARFFIFLASFFLVTGGIITLISQRGGQTQEEQGYKIMLAARDYITDADLRYDSAYFDEGYPPEHVGVCTDVVWKSFQSIDVNLKELVDWDIEHNPQEYADVLTVADPNIDFRYVPTLERFFQRKATVLTNDVSDILSWMPGDIVTFESDHVAIISDIRNLWGQPYVIQHGEDPAAEEDRLDAVDGKQVSGHFRWPLIS